MLLLVDDDEAKVGKPDVVRSERLRADHDLQFPATQPLLRFPRLRTRYGSRQAPHVNAERTEPLAECRDVLLRQDRRRHRDGNLFPCERNGRGRTQRYLRLTETDVTADDPIHGMTGREIVQDVLNRARLIDRREIWKARDEPLIGGPRSG